MSADNYIFLDRKTKKVYHCIASCICIHKRHCFSCQKGKLLGKGKTLKEAVSIADKGDNVYVEYGISLNLWCK